MLVERYVQRPRHIEIQVFGDTHGNCVYLFERDCSVQRRHQKVLEEAPAPGMTPERRARDGRGGGRGGARRSATSAPARSSSSPSRTARFYFMEMNTRLQVEHPVTEAITGLDLVEWQLRVAAGEPLPLTQDELAIHGHAIEARICAENPEANFLPATGTLHIARWPAHVAFRRNADAERFHEPAAVRIDAGVREGDAITPHYDSMIAKLIVWGATREQALARLDAALARHAHRRPAHQRRVPAPRASRTRSFAEADLDTALIERERAALFDQPRPAAARSPRPAWWRTRWPIERTQQDADPWSRRDGWRLHGGARAPLRIRLRRRARTPAMLERLHDGALTLEVGDGSAGRSRRAPSASSGTTCTLDGERADARRLRVRRDGGACSRADGRGAAAAKSTSSPTPATTPAKAAGSPRRCRAR